MKRKRSLGLRRLLSLSFSFHWFFHHLYLSLCILASLQLFQIEALSRSSVLSERTIDYYINAQCDSADGYSYFGGIFNSIANKSMLNFGYYDKVTNEVKDPYIRIGVDPDNLIYRPGDIGREKDNEAKVLALVCVPNTDIVLIGGRFNLGAYLNVTEVKNEKQTDNKNKNCNDAIANGDGTNPDCNNNGRGEEEGVGGG